MEFGTAVNQEHHHRLSRGQDCLDQIILISEKIEAVAIAGMLHCPGLA